jgi:putative tryptophan/tyrosine transport system substrate-binding protein
MNKRKLGSFALFVMLIALGFAAEAQQPKKVPRIGILTPGPVSPRLHFFEAFRHGLRDLGYVDGRNIIVEIQSADAKLERLPELAADLVRLQVEIIVTEGTPAAQSAKKVTQTIPIVMATSGNAVGAGLVDSLARPGGNITGLSFLATETYGRATQGDCS